MLWHATTYLYVEMSKSGFDRFMLRGLESEVDKKWKKWLTSFNYDVRGEVITDATRLFNLLLHAAGSVFFPKEITGRNRKTSASESFPVKFPVVQYFRPENFY